MVSESHSKISPTAKFVAYLRTFSDIPYSAEIALACGAKEVFEEIVGAHPEEFLWTAPMLEMRYKSVDAMLKIYYRENILELASGVSPRGLIWSEYRSCTYIETDLHEILAEKTAIIADILHRRPRRQLRMFPMNVLHQSAFQVAEDFFGGGPIAVIHEGLLPYLDYEEKERLARNIHRLLKKSGGIWITPDISSGDRIKKILELDPKLALVLRTISGLTDRDLLSNSFRTMEEAEEFFQECGFVVTKWKQCELVRNLSSVKKLGIDQKKIGPMLDRGQIWAMEVR